MFNQSFAEDVQRTGIWFVDAAQDLGNGRLARTIATQQRMDFAGPHFQGDVVKNLDGTKSLANAMAMDVGGVPLGILAGVATGLIVGVINGVISTRVGIPTFLTTLAMMGVAKGTSMWVSGTKAVPILSDGYNWFFGGGYVGSLSNRTFSIGRRR